MSEISNAHASRGQARNSIEGGLPGSTVANQRAHASSRRGSYYSANNCHWVGGEGLGPELSVSALFLPSWVTSV